VPGGRERRALLTGRSDAVEENNKVRWGHTISASEKHTEGALPMPGSALTHESKRESARALQAVAVVGGNPQMRIDGIILKITTLSLLFPSRRGGALRLHAPS
jgi:hypothetical protein